MANVTVRPEVMCAFFTKWHLEGLPRAAVLHCFTEADAGGGIFGDGHDHPWPFRSFILHGGYIERVFALDGSHQDFHRRPADSLEVAAGHIHRIIDLPTQECWTLILPRAWERKPGFYQFRDGQAWHRFCDEREFRLVEQARAA